MSLSLLLAPLPGLFRAAWIDGGRLQDLLVAWDEADAVRPGALYWGRVAKAPPAADGVFVDLGKGLGGFLPRERGQPPAKEGERLLLRVKRAAEADKSLVVTRRVGRAAAPPAGTPSGLLAPGPSPLEQALARHRDRLGEILVETAAERARLAEGSDLPVALIADRLGGFDLDGAIEALLSPVAELTSGARLVIEPVTALTAIDVDAGRALAPKAGRRDPARLRRAVNEEALGELPRQVRLRNLGGQIAVDFLEPASKADLARLRQDLQESFGSEVPATRLASLGRGGLAILERPRRGPSLAELATEPCCPSGGGRRASARWSAFRLLSELRRSLVGQGGAGSRRAYRGLVLRVSPGLGAVLAGPAADLLDDLQDRLGRAADLEVLDGLEDEASTGELLG